MTTKNNTTANTAAATSRRDLLRGGLYGAGLVGLRSLFTGLPISYLLNPGRASADGTLPACSDKSKAQYLIMSISGSGDPLNANVPGTYEADAVHSADPTMAKTAFTLKGKNVSAALPWSTLPQWVLDRTCFFHHSTLTTIHPDMPKVLSLMGNTAAREMLPSIVSRNLASCLGTVQAPPVSLLGLSAGEYMTYQGRTLPNLNATALRDMLTHPAGPLTSAQKLRDQSMDKLYAIVKNSGTSTAAQKAYVDNLAISRNQARSIAEQLLENLTTIMDNGPEGQIVAAATLIKMNVTPVVAIKLPFGGDNHQDMGLKTEAAQTVTGVQQIGTLMAKLMEYGLQDQVTFASLHVFGRTLKSLGTVGRNHWANHHVSVIIGKPIKAGVIGGITPHANDFTAMDINSMTGAGVATGGDIPANESLSAWGKTLGTAVGVPQSVLDQNITLGKTVTAALSA